MVTKGIVKKGEYFDSMTLMMAARKLRDLSGVRDGAIIMGTRENRAILEASGLMVDEFQGSGDADLLLVVKAEDVSLAARALSEAESLLRSIRKPSATGAAPLPHSLDGALRILPGANLAMVSVAGRYAGDVAMRGLEHGLHVMLFSDNVPLETEIALKQFAIERDLLMMGPDCGTAIINGVPLAFANAVRRGDIGIVAAAGTGLQEVSCLISNAGGGISQAIGTGGRDVKDEVGGLMFLHALRLLAADPKTKVVALVSKPPHASVVDKIAREVRGIRKPVVAAFLGADADGLRKSGMVPVRSLHEAALQAVALSRGESVERIASLLTDGAEEQRALAASESAQLQPSQKYIRGLFSGGTFCYEAQVLLGDVLTEIHSNAPTGRSQKLRDSLRSEKHTMIDLGADDFTVGRPHPMIDYSLRCNRIVAEAADPEVAVILLDIVLGYGSNPDPPAEIVPAIRHARQTASANGRHVAFVCSVTGTDEDPQNRSLVVAGLKDCGVMVMESNAAACVLAGRIATCESK